MLSDLQSKIEELGCIEERDKFDGSLLYEDDQFEQLTNRTHYESTKLDLEHFWFIDKNTGRIIEKHVESRSCPMCESRESILLFNKLGFDHVKCKECDLIYVSNTLNDDAVLKHYENEDDWIQVMLSEEEQRVNSIMYQYALKYLGGINLSKRKALLDIGSGSGLFLEVAKKNGWQVKGIELNEELIKRSTQRGLDVGNYSLSELKKEKNTFDCISAWFVLEHVKDIRSFIADSTELLVSEGLLFLAVPNNDALITRLNGKDATTFAGHSHINAFTIDTLNALVLPYGYELVAAETQITQIHNIKKHIYQFGLSENSGLLNFINTLTSEYLHNNFLGSNLVTVFKKIK